MNKDTLYVISIFFIITIGFCLFLVDIFYSLDNWKPILLLLVLIIILLGIVIFLNNKYLNRKK